MSEGGASAAPNAWIPIWRWPEPEESAHGLLLRLVELNAYGSTTYVAELAGVKRIALAVGRRRELARLAEIVHCSLEKLAADSVQAVRTSKGGRTRTALAVRGVALSNRIHSISRRRLCPHCLDESRHHRFWWEITAITTCPRHGTTLVENCPCGANLSWRDGALFECRDCGNTDSHFLPRVPAASDLLRKDAYLLGRFGAATPDAVPILDQMSVYDAVATMERVGAAAEGFHHAWQNAATLGVRPEILQARGFDILRNGKLDEVLDRLWQDYKKQGGSRHDGFTSSYGWFYYWFNCKGGRNFSPLLAETFLAHGAELFSINTNSRLGDLPDNRRHKLSLKEAAARCDSSVFAMRQIGLALGLIRGEKRSGAQHSFSVEDIDRIAGYLKRACTLQEMSRDLGIGHKGAHQLIDAELLVPAIRGGSAHKHVYVFRKDDVAALLLRLAAGATPVETASPGLLDLSRVRGSYAASTADVLHTVLAGHLRVRERDASRRGLRGLYVEPRELATALADASGLSEISVSLAARMTRLNIRGVVKAARRGLLTPVRRNNKMMILKKSVEAFCLDYMMLAELCRELGETMKAVRAFMRESGIAPEPKLAACRHVGYPRAKTERLLARRRAEGYVGIRKESSKQVLVRAVRAVLQNAEHPVPSADMIRQLRQMKVRLGPSDDKQFFYASLWETRDEFVHIPSLGWWLKSRPYAPGCYSPGSEPTDPHTRIADVMVEMLAEAEHPIGKDAVLAELRRRGIRLTSTDPIAFLRKVVARNRDRIAKLTGLGYWLRSRRYAPARYDPVSCPSGTQTTWERIGSFVVDYLDRTKVPANHDQLLKMLATAGIVIRSRNRRDYINDALSRNPSRVVYLSQHGYWLRHMPFGPAGYRPRQTKKAA